MLDLNHILSTPGYDVQQFYAESSTPSLLMWQTWRKPRGINWVYMIGVGGGGSGGTGASSAATSGGGGGGGSAAQTTALLPAQFVPDILYVQAGFGGNPPLAAGSSGSNGVPTYVAIQPFTTATANMTVLLANGGLGGSAGTTAGGGGAVAGGTVATIANMCLAGRGYYNFLAGQNGIGGAAVGAASTSTTPQSTGLIVMGGAGGAGCSASVSAAGGGINTITGVLGAEFYPLPVAGGTAASGATPAGAGPSGFASRNLLMNFCGAGGGSASSTAGGTAGAGGRGAPGCGGGGGGGMNTTNTTLAPGGRGGGGFVYIISW